MTVRTESKNATKQRKIEMKYMGSNYFLFQDQLMTLTCCDLKDIIYQDFVLLLTNGSNRISEKNKANRDRKNIENENEKKKCLFFCFLLFFTQKLIPETLCKVRSDVISSKVFKLTYLNSI